MPSLAVTGTAACVRGGAPAGRPISDTKEAAQMSTRINRRTPASTFSIHFFGRGLVDDRRCDAVERFVSFTNGDTRRWPADASRAQQACGQPIPDVATFDEVRDMRPAYNEIIVCTALGTRSGIQLWRPAVCGILGDRRRRLPAASPERSPRPSNRCRSSAISGDIVLPYADSDLRRQCDGDSGRHRGAGRGTVAIPPPSSTLAVANDASLPSRLAASAQSPQRLPVGSIPEPIFPTLGTLD